jgi:hypothetical protein
MGGPAGEAAGPYWPARHSGPPGRPAPSRSSSCSSSRPAYRSGSGPTRPGPATRQAGQAPCPA